MKYALLFMLALVPLVFGCGGQNGAPTTATVSGRVTFIDGQPARDVPVVTRASRGFTNSNGSYLLENVRAKDEFVTVDFTLNGVAYAGQNLARAFDGEQTASVNILVAPVSDLARITGVVEDRDGNPLRNASVFAFADGAISSSRAVTDKDGRFTLERLIANVNYEINAGGAGYRSDTEGLSLARGENRFLRLVLGNPGSAATPVPQNVDAIAWTAPRTRDSQWNTVFKNIRRVAFGQPSPTVSTRLTPLGNPIEVEVTWDFITGADLLGFPIYRGRESGSIVGQDFLRDPLANTYLDGDVNLVPNTRYWYQVASANVFYTDGSNSASARSASVSVRPLSDLELTGVNAGVLTWRSVAFADQYRVFVFDRYPSEGIDAIHSATVTTTGYTVPSSVLGAGRRYYVIVIGTSESQTNRTVSEVGTFVY